MCTCSRYTKSNGVTEREIEIVKTTLKKADENKEDWSRELIQYKNAPISDTCLPLGHLLFTSRLKSKTLYTQQIIRCETFKDFERKTS